MLSFCPVATRVGFIFRLSAVVALNLSRDRNFVAVRPGGKPSGVIAEPACVGIPQTRYVLRHSLDFRARWPVRSSRCSGATQA